MSIVITSKKFKSYDLYNTDGGINYLNGVIGQKTVLTLQFYLEKTALNKWLQFDSGTKTITNYNRLDNSSFVNNSQFQVGETFAITNSVSNNSTFTIVSVTDRVITVVEAVTTENCEAANLYLNSVPDSLDFYYNIINNPTGNKSDFISTQDSTVTQKYITIKTLDPTDTSTVHSFLIGTDPYTWVTDTLTGNTSQCTIVGMGVSGYRQSYKIVHTFFQTPLWTKDKLTNYQNKIIPSNFLNGNAPQYIYCLEPKYSSNITVPALSFTDISTPSNISWYNQTNQRTRPVYTVNSVTYIDNATSLGIPRLDFNKTNNVTIVLKSSTGNITTGSKFVLDFIFCPLTESFYQNNQRTLRQNNANDRVVMSIGDSAANGEYYGGSYSVISNAQVVHTDDHTATITFTASFTTAAKTLLKTLSASDYNYAFGVITQDNGTSSSDFVDTVAVLCDFQLGDYNTAESNLLYFNDYAHVNKFPTIGTNETNDVKGYEGDLFYVEVPFQIETEIIQPIIKNVGMQIVAVKDGKADFILEENILATAQACITGGVQQINISKSRNYKLADGSPYNEISLQNTSKYDSSTKKGYLLHYPFALRYDYWNQIYQANQSNCPDISGDNLTVNNRWLNISNGWDLRLRFTADIIGTNGVITTVQADTDITITATNGEPDSGENFTPTVYLLDENNNQVSALIKGGVTKVVALYTGDYTNYPSFGTSVDSIEATIGLDVVNNGGVNQRRLANSATPSESDSPWQPVDANPNASASWANGNARVDLFQDVDGNPTALTITSLYTDKGNGGNTNNPPFGDLTSANGCSQPFSFGVGGAIIFTQITPVNSGLREWSDMVGHLWSDLEPAEFH